jgi:hypothetical protein
MRQWAVISDQLSVGIWGGFGRLLFLGNQGSYWGLMEMIGVLEGIGGEMGIVLGHFVGSWGVCG